MMLRELIVTFCDSIVARACGRMEARPSSLPRRPQRVVASFLGGVVEGLEADEAPDSTATTVAREAEAHGVECLRQHLDIADVVHFYGAIGEAVAAHALEVRAHVDASEFRLLNQYIEDAIAAAVTAYEQRREAELSEADGVRQIAWAHEFDLALNSAIASFDFMKCGAVGVHGSAGVIHARTLSRMRALLAGVLCGEESMPSR